MNIDEWLSIADLDEISFNLFSAPIQPEFLEAYRVSTLVNSPKNNGENLIQPE
jgi:putative SOS response-associated peptidase YedK